MTSLLNEKKSKVLAVMTVKSRKLLRSFPASPPKIGGESYFGGVDPIFLFPQDFLSDLTFAMWGCFGYFRYLGILDVVFYNPESLD